MTKDAEYQMRHHRGVVSNKQQLIQTLEETYKTAASQKVFFKTLQKNGLELYSRSGTITGVKTSRKFRFKKLGYTSEILQLLDKQICKNVRLEALRQIRDHQQEHSKGRKRIRKRGR